MRLSIGLAFATLLVIPYGCEASSDTKAGTTTTSSSGSAASGGASGAGGDPGFGGFNSGGSGGGLSCVPPDMLIVLDRTMSMHREPNGDPAEDTPSGLQLSKWWIAVEAIESATATYEQGMRFGLELFPWAPAGDVCVTLQERIGGTTATNTQCQQGEVVVEPKMSAAADIAAAIDPLTTRLCRSTPIGPGLQTAAVQLADTKQTDTETRDQYALLITDGQDTCANSGSQPVVEVQTLAAAGVKTYVVGFDASGGTGVDTEELNHMACAGRTAADFANNCVDDGNGNFSWDTNAAPIVYIVAENAGDLNQALADIAAAVCCDCID